MFVLRTSHMFYVLRKLIITVPVDLCDLLIYDKTLLYYTNLNKNSKMTKILRTIFVIFDSYELHHLYIMLLLSCPEIFSVSYINNRPRTPCLFIVYKLSR